MRLVLKIPLYANHQIHISAQKSKGINPHSASLEFYNPNSRPKIHLESQSHFNTIHHTHYCKTPYLYPYLYTMKIYIELKIYFN
jgi:hypothetical protein